MTESKCEGKKPITLDKIVSIGEEGTGSTEVYVQVYKVVCLIIKEQLLLLWGMSKRLQESVNNKVLKVMNISTAILEKRKVVYMRRSTRISTT